MGGNGLNYLALHQKIAEAKVVWSCNSGHGEHEVGCPHKSWTNEELLDALITKKKFEQSGLAGTILTD